MVTIPRLARRLAKALAITFLVVFTGWFAFYMIFALPNPARVDDPLEVLKDADTSPKQPLTVYKDLLFELDNAKVWAPSLPVGLGALGGVDFFAEYPFAKLANNAKTAVSMTQGKHAMFLRQMNALYMPTPAEVSYTLEIPEGATLRFSSSILSRLNEKELAPVTFTLTAQDAAGNKQTLFNDRRGPEPKFPWSENDELYRSFIKFIKIDSGWWNGKWHEHEVSLAHFAGKKVTLTFTAKSADNSLSHGFIGLPRIYTPAHNGKPNVIVVVLDTLRADFVGANNPEVAGLTPNMDRLAADGVNFNNVRSHGNWSRGSFASIFTGTVVPKFGYADRWSYLKEEKAVYNRRSIPSLAEEFRKNGYTTISVGNNPFVYDGGPVGLHLGFDEAIDIQRQPFDTEFVTTEGIRWLKVHRDERFFMMFTLNTAHSPFRPPVKYFLRGLTTQSRYLLNPQAMMFRGVAAYADDYLGKFLTALDKLGLSKNSIIVVTADHGIVIYRNGAFKAHPKGDYELITATHTHTLYEEEIRVPLIINGATDAKRGLTSNAQAGLFDLAPTLADLAGLNTKVKWDGQSLAPIMKGGDAPEGLKTRILTAEGEQVWSMVTPDGFKYLRRGLEMPRTLDGALKKPRSVREEVYDINADPAETQDLSQTNTELTVKLRERFDSEYPEHINIHKITARGVDKLKSIRLDISTTGRFVFLETAPAEGNPNLKTAVDESATNRRVVNLKGIGSHVRIFFEVEPFNAPVTIKTMDGDGNPLAEGSVNLGSMALPAPAGPVTVTAGKEHFFLGDPERLADERMKKDGVYIVNIPFRKWRADQAEGAKLDSELETLMRKWGYL
ncbi:MAG: sulfatase [Nitrospinae bacterium]|nr:sulfatase [Nitrospinota bacterium]